MLNQENQRLARKITRDAKISQARRENAENQISGYVYDTPVIHGGRGVLGRGSGEISPSVDKKSELVPQVDLVKRIKPTEATNVIFEANYIIGCMQQPSILLFYKIFGYSKQSFFASKHLTKLAAKS